MQSHSWSLVVTRSHSWSLVVTRGHLWSTRGHSWSLAVTRGHSWSLVCTFRHDPNSLLLAREHSPHVNNKPISIPYLEQGYRCNITIFNLKVKFDSNNAICSRLMKVIPK